MNKENIIDNLDVEIFEIKNMDEFENRIKTGINLFFLSAGWSQTGKLLEKEIEKIVEKYKEKIKVNYINIDIFQDVAIKYQIISFPCILIFKNNNLEDQLVGYLTEKTLSEKIEVLF